MKLHCQICSVNGKHMSQDSEIATIDRSKLKLPLTPEMFTSIDPEREIPAPWMPGVDWQTMKCPRGNHLPWGIQFDETDDAIKDGGPKQLLTDQGMIDVKPVSITICPVCGGEFQNKGFQNHLRACKRKHEA